MITGVVLAAIIGYLIGKPIYDIMETTVNLSPLVMLGVGLIAAIVLIRLWTGYGGRVTVPLIITFGLVLVVLGASGMVNV